MSIKTVNSVIFSPCGGTKNVIDALTQNIDRPVRNHDITLPDRRAEGLEFGKDDFVFFGFPVYGGRMPRNIKKLFEGIKGSNTPCALVVVYGNRAFDGAMKDLHEAAAAAGFMPVAGVAAIAEHSIAPMIATARPDGTDRAFLEEWGKRILDFENNGMKLSAAPGEYPDWIVPAGMSHLPVTDMDKCVECGICVQFCPTGAILSERPSETIGSECIFCGACAKNCPEKARTIGNDIFQEFAKPHLVEASRRKEVELFHD